MTNEQKLMEFINENEGMKETFIEFVQGTGIKSADYAMQATKEAVNFLAEKEIKEIQQELEDLQKNKIDKLEDNLLITLDYLNEQIKIYQNYIVKEGNEQEFIDSVTEDIRIYKELFPDEKDEWDFTADEKVIEDIKNLVEEAI